MCRDNNNNNNTFNDIVQFNYIVESRYVGPLITMFILSIKYLYLLSNVETLWKFVSNNMEAP